MQRWPLFLLLGFFGRTLAADPSTVKAIDHGPWTASLSRFVDERGLVDYRGLAKDRATFDAYVQLVETVSPQNRPDLFPTRNHELAFYLNAYNALIFKGVLARGPEEESVWKGLVSGLNFFKMMSIVVGGRSTNLSDLENDIIRARYLDPRIHAALNCASIGCPRLRREAYLPENLDAQLDQACRDWVNDPYHVAPDPAGARVRVNKIFDWFADDFKNEEKRRGAAAPGTLSWINRYRSSEAQIPANYRLEINDYDKAINKQ